MRSALGPDPNLAKHEAKQQLGFEAPDPLLARDEDLRRKVNKALGEQKEPYDGLYIPTAKIEEKCEGLLSQPMEIIGEIERVDWKQKYKETHMESADWKQKYEETQQSIKELLAERSKLYTHISHLKKKQAEPLDKKAPSGPLQYEGTFHVTFHQNTVLGVHIATENWEIAVKQVTIFVPITASNKAVEVTGQMSVDAQGVAVIT